MKIKLDDLEAFIAVAELGSFSRAADELNITQSALSRRLRKLEEVLGTRLLDRTSRRISLSVVGAEFLPEAARVVGEFNRSLGDIRELIDVRAGTVSIASNMTISDTVLPEIIATFRAAHPNIRVRVSESSSPSALERVSRREAELAIAQFGEGLPELEFEPLMEDRFVVVSHASHPLAGREGLKWRDLAGHNFIRMRTGSGTTNLLERALGDQARDLRGDIEVGHFNALLAMVGRNLGISAIPTLVRFKRVDLDLAATPVCDPMVSRDLGLVTHRGHSLSPAGEAMRQICRGILGRLTPAHPSGGVRGARSPAP